MSVLCISLFGSLTVELGARDHGARIELPRRTAQLLGILAIGLGRRYSRSELIQMLWDEGDRGGSAASLNTALWRLRKAVSAWSCSHGDLISCDSRGGVALQIGPAVWVDLGEFERLAAPGLSKPVDTLTAADVDSLQEAVRLYRSDLLVDMSASWAHCERERRRRSFHLALEHLMRYRTLHGKYDEAILWAQRILESDPLREDIHRELMALFVRHGQRAHALRQFEHCRHLLRTELAISPMAETIALYQQLASQALQLQQTISAQPPADPRGRLNHDARESLHQARRLLADVERQLHALAN